jgi:hypothetical protein
MTTEFKYDTNLDEFVSDYYDMENARHDSHRDIAMMYIEAALDPVIIPTDAELEAEVESLIPQIAYLRPPGHPVKRKLKR